MATHWHFDIETLVLVGATLCLLLLYCLIANFGLAKKMDGKHSDSDDDY